jgi:hypothetical protein
MFLFSVTMLNYNHSDAILVSLRFNSSPDFGDRLHAFPTGTWFSRRAGA